MRNDWNIFGDYHTHTLYSRHGHGKGTIRQNVEAALAKGLTEIVISDHGPGHITFGVKRIWIPSIRREIDALNQEYAGRIRIYFGIEANVLTYQGDIDVSQEDLAYLDKLIVGFHYGIIPRNINSFFLLMIVNPIARLIPAIKSWVAEKNTDALIAVMNRYRVDIISHPGAKVPLNIGCLAQEARRQGTALELNSSHPFLSTEAVKLAYPAGCSFTIGSDAHTPNRVGHFGNCLERLKEAGAEDAIVLNATQ